MPDSLGDLDPRRAAQHLWLEVQEESPLWDTGGGYKTADAPPGPYTNAVVGWPFASWVFSRWLEAGLLELDVRGDVLDNADDPARPSWFARLSESSLDYFTLSREDSSDLLQDISRWSSQGVDGNVQVIRTDAADGLDQNDWIDVLQPFEGAPAIGQDLTSKSDLEYRIATTDTTALNRWFVFRGNDDTHPEILPDPRIASPG